MQITKRHEGCHDAWTVQAETYALTFAADRPFVYVYGPGGEKILELFALSSIQPLHGRDDTAAVEAWRVVDDGDEVICTLQARSSIWAGKTYRFRCAAQRFRYEMSVEGRGRLAEVNYFGGYSSASLRWGSGFSYSGQRFSQGFTPEPNSAEAAYFAPGGVAAIDLMGVPVPGRDDWFFTPPPFCFAFAVGAPLASAQVGVDLASVPTWLALGVEAAAGCNRFTAYTYHGRRDAFHLSLDFEGYTEVKGEYTLPAIGFDFAASEWEALAAHLTPRSPLLATEKMSPGEGKKGMRTSASSVEPWWHEPIFCGWGAQSNVAREREGRAPDYARQDIYEEFLATLEQRGVHPGTVVIDDKWQATYGENDVDEAKWPDPRGFVDARHAAEQRVLLWLKAWDPEGVPPEECIRNAAGLPIAVDPTNPAFERRMRAGIRRMLGVGGYGADGFKVDFSARIPSGPGMLQYGDAWGLELLRVWLLILRDEAKQVKPDALIITHTPHPYLTDLVDMIRLNDINTGQPVLEAMRRRAAVARLACPTALIDTDNWPMPDKATWRAYTSIQPELGVPALYYVTHIDATGEPLGEEDYALIRETWARHRAQRQGS